MRKSWLFCVFWLGCGSPILPATKDLDSGMSGEDDAGWSSGTTNGGATDDAGDDGGPAPLENPTVSYVSAICTEGTTAFWKLQMVASDPQGIDTLSDDASCDVYPVGTAEGDPTDSFSLECDGAGSCRQNYDGEPLGVLCSAASSWDFHFKIMDEDGYFSSVEVVTGVVD